jgi:hypothetical protein
MKLNEYLVKQISECDTEPDENTSRVVEMMDETQRGPKKKAPKKTKERTVPVAQGAEAPKVPTT